jgi:hypothetical protein
MSNAHSTTSIQAWFSRWANAWNKFWFTPTTAHSLAVMRILTGIIAFYTLLVWTFDLGGFINGGLVSPEYRELLYRTPLESAMAWSHFDWVAPALRMPLHFAGLVIVVLFTLGFYTRLTAVLTALLVISYCNRATGALFGLDQILAMLTLYLSISRCGDVFSIDSILAAKHRRRENSASVANTIATRLIQVHLCIVYLFAGLGKCQGDKWWDGEAIWGTIANHEYQTLDMLWLSQHMELVAVMTMLVLFWEVSYAALIWPRLTRPVVLLMAVPMHLGIGLCLGMLEFGLIMLVANIAFIPAGIFIGKQNR